MMQHVQPKLFEEETSMLPRERMESLQKKHALLSALIEQEENTRSADDLFVQKLKKQKLMIKDVLQGLRDRLAAQPERTGQVA